ncbi:hypothetical protein SAMN04488063_3501 [Halopelagius inordinatus]|uniref:Uncharacterized protein n=1 Tax=Halopelagius inordinatus TaxID=553467 RepID=A0A1I2WCV5_9EURY|nr:hypothetical protein SAMN04488063_3501 [Halopelagius inordinatus]
MYGVDRTASDSRADGRTSVSNSNEGGETIDVGVVVSHSPTAEVEPFRGFANRMVSDARDELCRGTGVEWAFYEEEPDRLDDGHSRRPSDFLDEATLRMVDGPYDAVVVVTDVPLISNRKRVVPGLASPVSRVIVVSTRRLLTSPRDQPIRALDSEPVRWNAAHLLLHLAGHVLDAGHDADCAVMRPFRFDPERRSVGSFAPKTRERLRRVAPSVPESADVDGVRNPLGRAAFHAESAVGNAGYVLRSLVRNRAPLLPLSLPGLTTAAVAPTLVLVFSAETWDVGIHMGDATAAGFASLSIVAATLYLAFAQSLFFPRDPHQVMTEHMAVVNVVVLATMFSAVLGLFTLVALLMLVIELFVFPPDLISTWPSLQNPAVSIVDLVRTAGFISTIGVVTGAIAGGLESRTVVRHLSLFLDRP